MINWSHFLCSWLYLQTSRNAYRTYPAEVFEKITTWLLLINKVPLFIAYLRCTSWFFLSKFFTIPWIPLWIVEALPESYDLTHPSNCLSGQFLLLIPCSKICPDTNWFLWTSVKMTLSICLSPILFPFCLS